MAYQQFGTIQASDYNGFVGAINSTAANQLNTVWGVGNGRYGLNQTQVQQVVGNSASYKVTPAQWNALIDAMNALKNQQGSTIVPISVTSQGQLITAQMTTETTPRAQFLANLTTLYTNANNAAAQGNTTSVITTRSTTWTNAITFVHTITFPSANQARYFFNAGGQIVLTFGAQSGNFVNDMWNKLCTACGAIYISSGNGWTSNIAGTLFNGIQKVGGSGTPVTIAGSQNRGYYGLTTSNQEIFRQLASVGPSGYLGSFLSISARTNGAQGANGDNGNIITVTTTFDNIPNGGNTTRGTVAANSTVTCALRYPSVTYLNNTWGSGVIIGSVAGS